MDITLERGGGIAGDLNHQVLGPVDTDTGIRGEVVARLEELNFFDMNADWPDSRRVSDAMWHSLRAVQNGRDRTVRWTDRQAPPSQLKEAYLKVESLAEWSAFES